MSEPGKLDPTQIEANLDAIVDYLLKDQDLVLIQELRHRIEELNRLLVTLQARRIRVDLSVSESDMSSGDVLSVLDARAYKRL